MRIIGRYQEQRTLTSCVESRQPEFVVVYGRRRVGKTFLVRQFFNDNFAFRMTGEYGGSMAAQLEHFDAAIGRYGKPVDVPTQNWRRAFEILRDLVQTSKTREQGKRIIFFDELAWIDTHKSGFLSALEHFWNDWASGQEDLVLVACGSVSSWIVKKLLKNKGGLHNRVTKRLLLAPFSLSECDELLAEMGLAYTKKDIADSYMVFGGVPYYLSLFERGQSVAQNVDNLCFATNAPLKDEFTELFASLFDSSHNYLRIIRSLARKQKGLTREEIIAQTGLSSGGNLTTMLDDLELAGFIYRYDDYSGTKDYYLYKLVDFFCLFYLRFMEGSRRKDPQFWVNYQGKGAYNNWVGHAFELLCLLHVEQIRDALSIAGVSTTISSWCDPALGSNLQIDLVLDRNDGIIDLCEMKYCKGEFVIDKDYATKLEDKKAAFERHTRTKKAVHTILVAREGLKTNSYSHTVQETLDLADLWDRRRRRS